MGTAGQGTLGSTLHTPHCVRDRSCRQPHTTGVKSSAPQIPAARVGTPAACRLWAAVPASAQGSWQPRDQTRRSWADGLIPKAAGWHRAGPGQSAAHGARPRSPAAAQRLGSDQPRSQPAPPGSAPAALRRRERGAGAPAGRALPGRSRSTEPRPSPGRPERPLQPWGRQPGAASGPRAGLAAPRQAGNPGVPAPPLSAPPPPLPIKLPLLRTRCMLGSVQALLGGLRACRRGTCPSHRDAGGGG